jgi:ankyrin repeat protein
MNQEPIETLIAAIRSGDAVQVERLLEGDPALADGRDSAGADVDAQQSGGYTALHSAARHGDVAMVRVLLAHGADPSITAADGRTARAFAEESGSSPEIVRWLVRLLSAG